MSKNETLDKYFLELTHSYNNIKHLSQFLLKDKNSNIDKALDIISSKIKKIKKSSSKKELDEYINLNKVYFEYNKRRKDI